MLTDAELIGVLIFILVFVTGTFARYSVQAGLNIKLYAPLLFSIIFAIALLHSRISYPFEFIESVWRSLGVAATFVVAFFGFRYLVRTFEQQGRHR